MDLGRNVTNDRVDKYHMAVLSYRVNLIMYFKGAVLLNWSALMILWNRRRFKNSHQLFLLPLYWLFDIMSQSNVTLNDDASYRDMETRSEELVRHISFEVELFLREVIFVGIHQSVGIIAVFVLFPPLDRVLHIGKDQRVSPKARLTSKRLTKCRFGWKLVKIFFHLSDKATRRFTNF